MNSEAVFLINKATEQFVECLALEVGYILVFYTFYAGVYALQLYIFNASHGISQASHFMGGRKTLVGR